jgi:hypothetical protein
MYPQSADCVASASSAALAVAAAKIRNGFELDQRLIQQRGFP